jgi:hypothetical protein
MKKNILTFALTVSCLAASAQGEFDVLRMSQSDIIGTARYMSMSGAFGALGGDISAIAVNPAGIGIYRSSDFSLTPSLMGSYSNAKMDRIETKVSHITPMLNGFGYVGAFNTYEGSPITSINFAISYGKTADFNQKTNTISGGRVSSLIQYIANEENYNFDHDYDHSAFFNYVDKTNLIVTNTSTTPKYSTPLEDDELSTGDMQLSESGGIHSLNLTLGANFSHTLYVGMGIGVQSVDYERNSSYVEEYGEGGGSELRNALSTTGNGVDFKIGFIMKPDANSRLGVSYNSGTYYKLTDAFQASMASWGFSGGSQKYIGSSDYIDYAVRTPWKWTFSGAYVFNKSGLISLDVDYMDNTTHSMMDANGFEYSDINSYILSDFRKTLNVRLGGELRVSDNVSLRMGGAWYQSPLVDNLENLSIAIPYTRPEYSMLRDTWYGSFGVGYRSGNFYADIAVQEKFANENFFFYSDENMRNEYAEISREKLSLALTMGVRF